MRIWRSGLSQYESDMKSILEEYVGKKLKKPKHKPKSFKKMDDIEQVDSQTYYVKGSNPEPYMVFNSIHEGWCCDCMNFTLNIDDSGKGKDCKHILAVKKQYRL
jgi:predicted nucleic acid-binding Zn finger protein